MCFFLGKLLDSGAKVLPMLLLRVSLTWDEVTALA